MTMKKAIRLLSSLIILTVFAGCRDDTYVYERTCWNGGVVIYQEKLVYGTGGWTTLDGYRPDSPYGDVACTTKIVGKRKKE